MRMRMRYHAHRAVPLISILVPMAPDESLDPYYVSLPRRAAARQPGAHVRMHAFVCGSQHRSRSLTAGTMGLSRRHLQRHGRRHRDHLSLTQR